MTGLVRTVRETLDKGCLVDGGLTKQGCKVSLRGTPRSRLIVDFDKPASPLGPDQTRCDYLFVAEVDEGPGWIVPLELKRGRLRADEAVRQLQAGALAAERLVPSGEQVRFRPIAVAGSTPKAERSRLKGKNGRIRFHDCAESVRLMSCGAPLARMLGS